MSSFPHLLALIETAAQGLPSVAKKRMFGCDGLFANDNIFALVWKTGRLGVRLPEAAEYASLMGEKGADPWRAGPMTMSHWVLVPETMHGQPRALAAWVKKAHTMAVSAPPGKKAAKKAPAKKAAPAKKSVAKKSAPKRVAKKK